MTDRYEFHVQGLIGPVVRSALPELTSADGGRQTRLFGTADEPADVELLLRRLSDNGLVADHILLSTRIRWCTPPCVEPVDPGAAPADDPYGLNSAVSAPRQS